MSRARGARSAFAGAFESTYGTAPGSGFKSLPIVSSTVGSMQELLENDLLGQGRDPMAPDLDAIDVNGDIQVPVDAESFGFWLKGLFGAPVTTGTDPFTHVFTSGGWTLPSIALETGLPDVPRFFMDTGLKVNTAAISWSRKGRASARLGLIGKAEATASATAAGSPTDYAYKRFMQAHGEISRAGAPLAEVVSVDFNYSNNLDVVDGVGSGGSILGLDGGMASATMSLTMRFASMTLLDQALSGAAAAFQFGFDNGTESLIFALPKLHLPKPKVTVEGPAGVQVTFAGIAAQDDDGDPMLTATLINSVESY